MDAELSKNAQNKQKKKEKAEKPAAAVETGPKTLKVYYCADATPELAFVVSAICGVVGNIATNITKTGVSHVPYLIHDPNEDGSSRESLSGDTNMARFILRNKPTEACVYNNTDAFTTSQIDQWLDYATAVTYGNVTLAEAAALINTHVESRTFLTGKTLSVGDVACFLALRREKFVPAPVAAPAAGAPAVAVVPTVTPPTHALRWYKAVEAALKDFPTAKEVISATIVKAVSNRVVKEAAAASDKASGDKTGAAAAAGEKDQRASEDGAICPPLENAVEGAVCTRFPPEPSGYLHIGHAKAVLLNQYYAARYKGKLIVRFDDTNPDKEKDEYEQAIIADLASLGVVATVVTHTSDSFEIIEGYARQMIQDGLAYMDDTNQEKMQAERMAHIECARRSNSTIEDNLRIFQELLAGNAEYTNYCLRAKIDMASLNGTMRDPVLYRSNTEVPHHRTGFKFKAYPTYDFACPIVDAIEGVTHALRTTEYNDRDEQYHWIQKALRLRHVYIYSFGKMNFVHTVLSKRKLNWFVQNNLVEGWFDPRFPTIQGCVRRGINVQALKNFILSQGASRRIITMEWDKFWADNKKVWEEVSTRYMGITQENAVEFTVTNVDASVDGEMVDVPVHPLKAEMGTRVMRRNNVLYIEQEDAVTFTVGEEVTLLRWGNFIIDEIVRNEAGNRVVSMKGRFNADAKNFSKTKKAHWLAKVSNTITCQLVEFDHLINKAKLTDEDAFEDFLNPVTRYESTAYCDVLVDGLAAGTVIQLERKGFYRIDHRCPTTNRPVLFYIPDGKLVKTLAEKIASKA